MVLSVSAPSRGLVVNKPQEWNSRKSRGSQMFQLRWRSGEGISGRVRVRASCFPIDEPILREALKEPVAFMGGMFAGLLRLDLNEDPLKEWVTRTVEASGITEEDIDAEGNKAGEEAPQQIEIE